MTAAPNRPRSRALRERSSKSLKAAVWARDKGRCQLCGQLILLGQLSTLDHIKPSSHGGSTVYANVRLAHKHCNTLRSNPHPVEGKYR